MGAYHGLPGWRAIPSGCTEYRFLSGPVLAGPGACTCMYWPVRIRKSRKVRPAGEYGVDSGEIQVGGVGRREGTTKYYLQRACRASQAGAASITSRGRKPNQPPPLKSSPLSRIRLLQSHSPTLWPASSHSLSPARVHHLLSALLVHTKSLALVDPSSP